MVFEGTRIVFGLLKWVAAGIAVVGLIVGFFLWMSVKTTSPGDLFSAMSWWATGMGGLGLWAVFAIGEMVGDIAQSSRDAVASAKAAGQRQG